MAVDRALGGLTLGTIADYIALGILIALALWTEARLYLRGQVITGAPRCDLRRLILEINIRELLARRCPSRQRRRRCSRLTKGRGSGGLATDNSECQTLILMTDKFASSERHNKWKTMSAPTQVGVSGDGGR